MLKFLKIIFGKYPPPDPGLKNKVRFESIHSHGGALSLKDIYDRLISNDQDILNEEIVERYKRFSKRIQTNTFSAAELELASISTLCYFRPELTGVLIRNGLLCIVWSLGDNINFNDVINFVQFGILAKDSEPYGGWPHKEGITWLSEILPNNRKLVEEILIDVIQRNKEELNSSPR